MTFGDLLTVSVRMSGRSYRAIAAAAPINYYRLLRLTRGIAQPRPDEIRRLVAVLPLMAEVSVAVRDRRRDRIGGERG